MAQSVYQLSLPTLDIFRNDSKRFQSKFFLAGYRDYKGVLTLREISEVDYRGKP